MLMLEGLNQDSIDFKPNYDNTTVEPITLPSKFPYLLCGNNSGIAVGMSSDLVSHNFTEVAAAIKYYMANKETCTIPDLMRFIKGPDFPTGGLITNGNELLSIYSTGKGAVKVTAHYDIVKQGQKTNIIFHDLPYGVEIDSGVKAPLKKLVLDEGYDCFEDINVKKVAAKKFDIIVTLSKGANVAKSLDILLSKTRLSDSIKINQTVIVDGEPRILNLKELIGYWVDYRSGIIQRIAANDHKKVSHKLTITIGLQKCMSNIERVIEIVRFDATPKATLMREFSLSDEQATAVLDIKLSRLSRLEVEKLNKEEKDLEAQLEELTKIIKDESVRYSRIAADLDEIKKTIGADERLTEILNYEAPETEGLPRIKKDWFIYADEAGTNAAQNEVITGQGLIDYVSAYGADEIYVYNKEGEMGPLGPSSVCNAIRAFVKNKDKNKLISITANGNIKVSYCAEYKWKKNEKVMRIKEDDNLVFVGVANDDDYIMLFGEGRTLKLAVKDLNITSKITTGTKSGLTKIIGADVVTNADKLLMVTSENKAKLTSVQDFGVDNRGNKGQSIPETTNYCRKIEDGRETICLINKTGRVTEFSLNKLSLKGKSALGVTLTSKSIMKIV